MRTSSHQISRSIEDSIREGRVEPGETLPAVRALAEEWGVSPATAAAAYRDLRQRGWVTTGGRRGTRVSAGFPSNRRTAAVVADGVVNLADGNPDATLLPDLSPALKKLKPKPLLYGADVKSARLCELAAKQFADDGIDARYLAVTSGALDGIERVLAARLRAGDRVLVEDPGFPGVHDLVRAMGFVAIPVRLDREGPYPGAVRAALGKAGVEGRHAAAFIVTPRAQNPTGVALSERRVAQLVSIIRRYPALLLVEDDHAAGVAGAPARTLVSGSLERWAVVRSVSKSLGPDLRVAVVAGDSETIERVEGRQRTGMGWVSHVLQELVAELWSSAEVKRQLRAAERAYAERRHALVEAFATGAGSAGFIATGESGLNVWIRVGAESGTVRALSERGWAVSGGDRFRIDTGAAIRVTISRLLPDDAPRFAKALRDVTVPASVSATT
jgi:DNA-binding transcriptional MocR family regulator